MTTPPDDVERPDRPELGADDAVPEARDATRGADRGWQGGRAAIRARIQAEHERPGRDVDLDPRARGRARRGPRDPRARLEAGPFGTRWGPRRARPEWWPADETWPPARRRPWRGFGCLFGILVAGGALGLVSFALGIVGSVLDAPGPVGIAIRVAAVAVAAGVLVGFVRAGRSIRRAGIVLDEIVEQAGRVEAGDYTARVELDRPMPGPVASLARGFNTMAARLEADETGRRTLLADVTHELRTPLTVVQGSIEAIIDGVHPPDADHLGAILDETRVLDRLIDDLRTLALSESGALSLHREPTDLAILATDAVTGFSAAAATAGIELTTSMPDDLPPLEIDAVRIREVLGNLIANALRHTPTGGSVAVDARRVGGAGGGADGGPSIVEIRVQDTGTGIDPELLAHVFERFARGGSSTGSGLGLSIARSLVELHGGSIRAESPPGAGTTIVIHLPKRVPDR